MLSCLKGMPLIYNLIKVVFPEVNRQLTLWKSLAGNIDDEILKEQASMSLDKKKFHCQGGCAYALYPSASFVDSVEFIVAYQTISDYLDNLCDRAGLFDEAAFRQLHLALFDAVDAEQATHDHYLYYPHKNDGGYLLGLVEVCRQQIQKLPSYGLVKEKIKLLVDHYSDLQVYKHIAPALREERLRHWAAPLAAQYPDLSVWEFCAAAGSTLEVFLLVTAAQNPDLTQSEVDDINDVYFPWVCALHILLDYFIDADEDKDGGDFNFTSYYKNIEECRDRIAYFVDQLLARCERLKYPKFHKTIIDGLLALYLSDPKANSATNKDASRSIIRCGGGSAVAYHRICRMLRGLGKL